jgi:hypothetical protein
MLTFGNMDAIISTTKHRLESDDSKILLHGGWAHKNVLFHMLFAIMTGDAVILTSMLHGPTEVAIIKSKKKWSILPALLLPNSNTAVSADVLALPPFDSLPTPYACCGSQCYATDASW